MPMMKSPFDQKIISLTGHSPEFKANVPLFVSNVRGLANECIARGAVYCEEGEAIPDLPAAPEEKSDNDADGEEGFKTALDGAILRILTRNDPADFKADLTPKVTKVTAEMSPDLRRPTATEVSDAYRKMQENIDLAE